MSHKAVNVYDAPEKSASSGVLPWLLAIMLAIILIVVGVALYV